MISDSGKSTVDLAKAHAGSQGACISGTCALPRELECRRRCAQASLKSTQLELVWFSLALALCGDCAACLPIVLVPSVYFPVCEFCYLINQTLRQAN